MSSSSEQLDVLTRNAVDVLPKGELEAKLAKGRPLRVKLGLDPTAGHVTLGWAVQLRRLRAFQDAGHTAVLIIGDYTAQIGDPSERADTRPMLSKDEVEANAGRVLDQFALVLAGENLEIRRNSEWLDPLGTKGVLELATHYTVARMLDRDDFAKRFASNTPISIRELLYPLLQGYDSVAVQADIELGGTDQHFNLMVGRHLQRTFGQEPQVIITSPLIEGTDGVHAMSQSRGNYVGITEPADEMFGKLMSLPDALMEKYFKLTTDLSDGEIGQALSLPPQEAKRKLAEGVVKLYHGVAAASDARAHFDHVFVEHRPPEDMPEKRIPSECIETDKVYIPRLLHALGLASSGSEGKRLIAPGGVHIEGRTIEAEEVTVDELRGKVLRVGKRRFVRLD